MKILQLTKKFPYPPKDGESIAVTNLAKSMKDLGCDVHLLSMNTFKHFVNLDALPASFNIYQEIHTVPLDNRITIWGALKNLFSSESYHVSRFVFDDFQEKLKSVLKNDFDLILLETLYLSPYIGLIKENSKAKILVRSHNVEFEIWERVAINTSFLPKKLYLKHLTKKLKRFEIAQFTNYDKLVTLTERDLDRYRKLGFQGDACVIPIGLNIEEYQLTNTNPKDSTISFIGSLDWMPNLEGLEWFLKEIFPRLIKKIPNSILHIAGRNTPTQILQLESSHIKVEGEVEDANAFISKHSLMIVPLLSGSGMRVKILEGMALGRVVISTSIGMEGINAKDREEIMVANTPSEFIEAIEWLYSENGRIDRIGKNARKFISENFDRKRNAERLLTFTAE